MASQYISEHPENSTNISLKHRQAPLLWTSSDSSHTTTDIASLQIVTFFLHVH